MADKKITALTDLGTSLAGEDLFQKKLFVMKRFFFCVDTSTFIS